MSEDNDSHHVAKVDVSYNNQLETLMSSEAEKALVLYWLHDKSEKRFTKLNVYITIPVITMSTVAGTASIGQSVIFGPGAAAPIIIGIVSITVAILNTIASFFGWAKRSEGHRISGNNYAKLHRWISIELALPREQRIPAKYFLKEIRQQMDRLGETSPQIPVEIIALFQTEMVKNVKSDVSLPEICNSIHAVTVYSEHNKLDNSGIKITITE